MKKHVRKTPLKQDCPVETTLNIIGGKWKPALLSGLFRGPQRPRDMSQALPEATKRVIAQQLRELEASGIITKKIYDEVPLRVEYSLTSLGQSLQPVMKALQEWGEAYEAPVSTAVQPQG